MSRLFDKNAHHHRHRETRPDDASETTAYREPDSTDRTDSSNDIPSTDSSKHTYFGRMKAFFGREPVIGTTSHFGPAPTLKPTIFGPAPTPESHSPASVPASVGPAALSSELLHLHRDQKARGEAENQGRSSLNLNQTYTIVDSDLTITSLEIRRMYVLRACGPHAPLFGFLGVIIAIGVPCLGVAFAVSKLSIAIATVGTTCLQPDLMTRSVLPVVMAELLAIYGLIVSIIIISNSEYLYAFAFAPRLMYVMLPTPVLQSPTQHLMHHSRDIQHSTDMHTSALAAAWG
jgi:ATP synthase proteolipid subunit